MTNDVRFRNILRKPVYMQPARISPERFRRTLISDKAISPELAADLTIRQFGTLYSVVPA